MINDGQYKIIESTTQEKVVKAIILLAVWIGVSLFSMASAKAQYVRGSVNLATNAASNLEALTERIIIAELFPGADRIGGVERTEDGNNPAAVVLDKADNILGFVFINTDYVSAIGYSGKPIHIAIAMGNDGLIKGAKLLKHSEPIVLIGIPAAKIEAFINGYKAINVVDIAAAEADVGTPADIVSGATVTIIVIDDAIKRSSVLFAQSRGIGNLKVQGAATKKLKPGPWEPSDWDTLMGDGSVRHLVLTAGDVNQAFIEHGNEKAISRPIKGDEKALFIDLHTALVSQPQIGKTLLGAREYKNLTDRLGEDQHAILIMANGQYSYRGSGFVRGGIFDRFQVVQGVSTWLFRDKVYKNMGEVPSGPKFSEVGLFRLPDDSEFDPTQPWRVQLLIQRPIGPIQKAFVNRSLDYILPARFVEDNPQSTSRGVQGDSIFVSAGDEDIKITPIVIKIWENKLPSLFLLGLMMVMLTAIFYGQRWLGRHPRLLKQTRISFLLLTLFWLGWYSNAQLSVVNVMTFAKAFIGDFNWNYFMMDPLLFVLWIAVAASMVLWGRGVFCGWLCPFGALQELTNMVAKKLKVPQIQVPWALHELMLSLKYLIFIGLFGLSLFSMTLAEQLAEIEPFKTAIILKFAREWPYVIYALTLLSVGLFIERFYCRYLCPLGAALAIPARLRTNDWLKRYYQCGNPCQRCANECMVQAIQPDGQIHPNECISCLHCQELYSCDQRCPVMIQKRVRREKMATRNAGSTSTLKKGQKEIQT
jgi:NosR/NirI family nitrous oxide reductase transcriptional regulator